MQITRFVKSTDNEGGVGGGVGVGESGVGWVWGSAVDFFIVYS